MESQGIGLNSEYCDICFMKKLLIILQYCVLLFPITLSALPALGEEARLSDIVITNTRDHLLVYFAVENCFTPELNQAIENGINTTFTFLVRLYEKRNWWLDKEIADKEINHSIKYDNIKKTYEVTLSEKDNRTITYQDFNEAKKQMAEVVALKVTALKDLRKGGRYRVRMMAQLDKIELPLYLHYVLFFLSLWDFETDWHEIDFRY